MAAVEDSFSDTVILLGTDTPIGLAIVRDLGRHGFAVVGIGRHANAIGGVSHHCRHHAVRAGGDTALIAQIRALATEHGAAFLLAISEADLLLLNRHRAELEATLTVLTPTGEQLSKVLDKAVCQTYAERVGIRVPRTLRVASLAEAEAAAPALPYPVVLKWADPNAASPKLAAAGLDMKKLQYAQTPQELIGRLTPYAAIGEFPLVQEYCPGNGVGHMFLAKDGEVLIEFQHERLHEWPPEGGASSLCRSVPLSQHVEARAKSRALVKALDWTGVAMVEYRYDRGTKTYSFMELNGRFWGSLPLAIAAGIPFAAGLVDACGRGRPVPHYDADYPPITCCFWIPETKRLLRILFQASKIQDPRFEIRRGQALVSYVLELFRPSTRYFIFSFADPKPFLADVRNVAVKALGTLFGRRG
jgi:predicted ATP-grasp superfamily ATP-dependent carboligase